MESFDQEIFDLVHTHFPQLSELNLQKEIAQIGKIHHFQSGEVILNFGSYVKQVPLLVKGAIKVTREDETD